MNTRSAMLLVMLTLTLAAGCRNSGETALTGGYGNAIVTGRVVTAGDSSPAGVTVSVRGTGMEMTVGADGRFAFAGVPARPELDFRLADGVTTTIQAEANARNLVVEVSATGSSRRRGAAQSLQYEGLIREVGATTIKVYTSHKDEVEFAVDANTVIRKGNRTYALAELQPEWRVHVKGLVKEGVLTALEIKVQNTNGADEGDDNGATMTANGLVTAKSGADLTVASQPKGPVTVRTDASTIIKKQGVRITVDQIAVGDEINAQGVRGDGDVLLARQIEVRGNSKKPKN